MAEKFTRYDTAEYLKTDSDMAAYLDACLEEAGDDPAFIAHALGVIARARGMSGSSRRSAASSTACDSISARASYSSPKLTSISSS